MCCRNPLKMLLQSVCINYPILETWKCGLDVPVGLVFSNQRQIYPYIKSLSDAPKVLTISNRLTEIENTLQHTNSEGIFFIMPEACRYKTGKNMEKIDLLFSAASNVGMSTKKTQAAIFLVFHQFIPEEYKGRLLEIRIDEAEAGNEEDVYTLLPDNLELSMVKDKFADMVANETQYLAVYAAAAFLYPKLKNRKDVYEKIVETAYTVIQRADTYYLENGTGDFIIELLYAAFIDGDIPVFELDEMDEEKRKKLKTAAFLRDNSLFVSEELFRIIFTPIIEKIGSNKVKACLCQQKILITEKTGYSTTMNYHYSGDKRHWFKARMLKFDLNRIPARDETQFKILL